MRVALLPPKPKEFVRAVRRAASRGPRTRSKVQAGSGVSMLTQGGRNPPRRAITQTTASTAPAKIVNRVDGLGTLAVGAPADVAVLAMEEGEFPLVDSQKNKVVAKRRIVSRLAIARGKRVA